MAHRSHPLFRTHHALRIKGFAKTEVVAEVAGHPVETAEQHLQELVEKGHAQFREARSLWQLTPDGRSAHAEALAIDTAHLHPESLTHIYDPFLALNSRFKELCGDWQLRNGVPNDHTDVAYDAAVVARLVALNAEAQPLVVAIGHEFERFADYSRRLAETCQRVVGGETTMFTGVMCGSYHDVWMELHEDLILTQGIDRAQEGSF
ncbi:unannotated protein [freshwater metagenome]|uniref:Unannotated protein n=1 Tax=freshwater metagenome TaxID=449393 RepID=A0A6J7E3D0_9ZZZZ|nr:MarR family transcriptional regulator [Actinomycetota bacterium]